MRILQLAPLWEAVPPPAYGGTEAVVSLLTEELVRQGHDVTLAASGDSVTSAALQSTLDRSLRQATDCADRNCYDWEHVASALAAARDFDVVHNHAGELPMAMSPLVDVPMLTTMHCLPTRDNARIWNRYEGAYNTISRSQSSIYAGAFVRPTFAGHVYNAIDVASFPFSETKGDYLLFLSRIAPEKGPHLAIEVTRRLGMRLIIAGKVDAYDRAFFEEVVREQIDGEQIVFVGEADAAMKRQLYVSAKCVLMPLCWDEPFGLVMPESMACGTPVIALRRGSAPELIVHGETGFVVDTVEEMADAVLDVGGIDARRCREHVTANFAPERMASEYVKRYEEMLARRRGEMSFVVETVLPSAKDQDGADPALAVA